MERPDVRDVADVAVEERDPARGIQRLEHEPSAGPQLVERQLEKSQKIRRLEVLDDLRRENPAERAIVDR